MSWLTETLPVIPGLDLATPRSIVLKQLHKPVGVLVTRGAGLSDPSLYSAKAAPQTCGGAGY